MRTKEKKMDDLEDRLEIHYFGVFKKDNRKIRIQAVCNKANVQLLNYLLKHKNEYLTSSQDINYQIKFTQDEENQLFCDIINATDE